MSGVGYTSLARDPRLLPSPTLVRKRKILDFIKCESCRVDKKKCLPTDRIWPDRCQRCIEMGLPCCEGRKKVRKKRNANPGQSLLHSAEVEEEMERTANHPSIAVESRSTTNRDDQRNEPNTTVDADSSVLTLQEFKDWIFLVSFHKLMTMAKDRYNRICDAQDDLFPGLYYRSAMRYINDTWDRFLHSLSLQIREKAVDILHSAKDDVPSCVLSALAGDFLSESSRGTSRLSREHCLLCSRIRKARLSHIEGIIETDKSFLEALQLHENIGTLFLIQMERLSGHAQHLYRGCEVSSSSVSTAWSHYMELSGSVRQKAIAVLEGNFEEIPPSVLISPLYIHEGISRYSNARGAEAHLDCLGRNWLHRHLDAGGHRIMEDIDQLEEFDAQDIIGRSPLHIACGRGCLDMVKKLLVRGANIRQEDIANLTPLHYAIASDSFDISQELLAIPEIDLNAQDDLGWTPLDIAIKKKHQRLSRLLISDERSDPNISSWENPIAQAYLLGDMEIVELLLTRGIDPNLSDLDGMTILMHAVHKKDMYMVKTLKEREDVSINEVDWQKRTALFIAAEVGFLEGVRLLAHHPEINLNSKDNNGYTPLIVAAKHGHVEVVKILLEIPDVDIELKRTDFTDEEVNSRNEIKDERILELIEAERSKRGLGPIPE